MNDPHIAAGTSTPTPTPPRARRRPARRPGAARQPALPQAASSTSTATPSARRARDHHRQRLLRSRRARCSARCCRAAERGVKVTLLLQGQYEYFMQHHTSRAMYGVLLGARHRDHRVRAELPARQGGGVRRPAGRDRDRRLVEPRSDQPAAGARGQRLRARRRLRRRAARPSARGGRSTTGARIDSVGAHEAAVHGAQPRWPGSPTR